MIRTIVATGKAAAFLSITLPLMPLQRLFLWLDLPQARSLPHVYHRLVCRILGVRLQIEGNAATPGLIAANHVSWLDISVLSAARSVSFIAKMEVCHWPFFGTLARLQNTLFVDRQNRLTTAQSNAALIQRLVRGETLVLFPEGTSNNGRALRPFKSSFFAAVEKAQLPLIPVTLIYQSQHGLPLTLRQRPDIAWYGDANLLPHLWGVLKGGPITARLIFHAPLRPEDFANRKALAKATESLLKASLAESLHGATKMR